MTVHIFNQHIRVPLLVLALAEVLALYLSVRLAFTIGSWFEISAVQQTDYSSNQPAIVYATILLMSLVAFGLYQFHQRAPFTDILARLLVAFFVGILVLAAFRTFVLQAEFSAAMMAMTTAIAFPIVGAIRFVFFRTVDNNVFRHNTLIYGAGKEALSVARIRRKSDRRGFRICGYVVANGREQCVANHKPEAVLLKGGKTLFNEARSVGADEIVVALDERRGQLPIDELLECRLNGIAVLDLQTFLERETGKVRTDLLSSPSWLIFSSGFSVGFMRRSVKRVMDVCACITGLIVLAPVIVGTAIAIGVESRFRHPILFRQTRIGLHGKEFTLYKFRSMTIDAEADGQARWATKHDDRITRVGKFIRKTRFDEIPQLLNVLLGHMSFVGPRPERPEFVEDLEREIPYYNVRHTVLPGITGWAQLKYPYGASVEESAEKLRYDLYYVKNHNVLLDIAIILQTFEVVFFGKGAR